MRAIHTLLICLACLGAAAADSGSEEQFQEALYLEVVEGDPQAALLVYRQLVGAARKPPTRARAQLGIGRCLQKLNRHAESLKALHLILRKHAGQVPVVQQALGMIRAYKSEAEQAVQAAHDQARLRDEKKVLEAKLKLAERKGQAVLKSLRQQLNNLRDRLRQLEREGAARPAGAGELLEELSRREAVRRKTASDLAERLLATALRERREGRYRQALRSLLLARHYSPDDSRIASQIATIKALVGEGDAPQLEQLRMEADRLRGQLEQQLARYQKQLDQIFQRTNDPLERLAALRSLMAQLPESLVSSPLANRMRSRIIQQMHSLSSKPQADGVPVPNQSGDRLAWYRLPQWIETRSIQGGGIRTIRLDRQLRPVRTTPFVPPSPQERRRDLHRALSQLVSLDDPRAAAFALPTSGRLMVIARPDVHRALRTVLSRMRRGQSQLYEVRLRIVQFAAGAAVPWARWAQNPAIAGDGAYLILDAPARQNLLEQLSEQGGWQSNTIGPLRLWARQQGLLEVIGKSVLLVGYRDRLISGRLRAEPVVRTLAEGLTLELRTHATETGMRIELLLEAMRLDRPVNTISTKAGRIQVPSRANQSMTLDAEVPRGGALVLFGLTNPIQLTRGRPGRLAVIIEPRTLAGGALPRGHIVRRYSLGSLATLTDDPMPDLGLQKAPAKLRDVMLRWLQGKDKQLKLSIAGSAITASGTPQSLAALKKRLANLRRLANRSERITLRSYHVAPKFLQPLSKLAGKPLINKTGALVTVVLTAKQGKLIADALAKAGAQAVPLKLPPGPYPGHGVARLVASRTATTRFVRDPGGPAAPARYASVTEGIVIALRALPNEILAVDFHIARLKEMVPTKRAHGIGFEPRRNIVSGHLAPILPPGSWALVTGIYDPARPKRTILLLVERGK